MTTSGPAFFHRRYTPGPELSRGAQGIVVRVTDRENPALPLVAKVWQGRSILVSSLHGEFALLSRLCIPGLVRAHDLARCEKTGTPFLIETFVDGPEVREWFDAIADRNKGTHVLFVLTAIASTLARLHDSGFLHGDLKPAHVRMVGAGQTIVPTLLDLGVAVSNARIDTAHIAYTPAFAAPEVRAGARPAATTDLYGLGATILTLVTGNPPGKRLRRRLFEEVPWLAPVVATLVDDLLAEHPGDRPQSAHEVVHRLGLSRLAPPVPPLPIGREDELQWLRQAKPTAIRWIIGPSGSGKTHLVRELHTQLLLQGRDVRRLQFPVVGDTVGKLVAYLRGNAFSLPFAFANHPVSAPVVILDDVHHAPEELVTALDVFRCREAGIDLPIEFVVTAREGPPHAPALRLEPLRDAAFTQLCQTFGIVDPEKIHALATATEKNPGWLVASLGSVPLEKDAILERARSLSAAAQDLLAILALSREEVPERVCHRFMKTVVDGTDPLAELSAAGLVTRRMTPAGFWYSLFSPNLAKDLARVLGSPECWNKAKNAWLDEESIPTSVLLELGTAEFSGSESVELLVRTCTQAHAEGMRGLEIEGLLALVNIEAQRTGPRLLQLERLLRDSNRASEHPRILEWLNAAAERDATLLPLVLRRNAEKLAREGQTVAAEEVAEHARRAAFEVNDPTAAALAIATQGVVALYRADWAKSEKYLNQAHDELENATGVDAEEKARIDHNIGVVALYRGRIEEAIGAFERALGTKRQLGDRAGIRSCLLNLGLALAKAERYDAAEQVLEESLALARSLRQTAGEGWCLVARADVCIRRRNVAKAREWLAEATQLEAALPQPIRADLALLQAEVGSLLTTQFQLAAMARTDLPEPQRMDFYLFIDEFQNFSTDAFASILAEARKYRLCLTLSHQYIDQLS
ncbi:MAG TPA: tetratricopeptide repeat protein, partial [Polyangium sp.]|nr:tetratricopeptide repeat protein [Polyangium sp.]